MSRSVLTMRRPDDWHVHLRDGEMLQTVASYTAARFGRAICMPNLDPPVTTVEMARAYGRRIRDALPSDVDFEPLTTCYLTDATTPDDLERGYREGVFAAAKLYPAGATTHSDQGVTQIERIIPALERMARLGMPLLVHGEVVDPQVDVFDREKVFLDRVLVPLLDELPTLRVVLEHITTAQAAALVADSSHTLAATITVHHLMMDRNALFRGGLRPHAFCLPVAKRSDDMRALRRAATSGSPRFFLGTDSAPHTRAQKERDCGCAGIFTAPAALELYAQVFEEEGALEHLEGFASLHGPAFYGRAPSEERVRLVRAPWRLPEEVETPLGPVRVFRGGLEVPWRLDHTSSSSSQIRSAQ